MTRKEAIERLDTMRKEMSNNLISDTGKLGRKMEESFKDLDALDMGLAYLSRDMKEWIKTKERLPVEGDNVLLYVNDGRDKYITFGYIFSYDEEVFVFCTFGDEYIDESKVPYWMPLPESPEKKRYIIVSQGIKIAEFDNKEEAEAVVKKENEEFYKYQQECLDKGEPYADTEIFMYEEACGEIEESEDENA